MIDLLVVGGGPVGLVTAVHARIAGLEVAVVEPHPQRRDKACGEGLMPEALRHLQRLGVDPEGADLRGIRYVDDRSAAVAAFRSGPGRGVRRTTLHAALDERVRELGVRRIHARVEDVDVDRGGVLAAGHEARYLIAADGLHSTVRSRVGLDGRRRGPRRYGLRQHVAVAPWSDLVEVHWTPTCELYVTPVGPDLVGVAALGPRPLDLGRAVAAAPSLAARLDGAPLVGGVLGAGPFLQPVRGRVAGRVLLVGDAAGYIDALTGEGLRLGFESARAAVGAVVRDDPQSYAREWSSMTRSSRWLTRTLLTAASSSATRPRIVPAAQLLPGAFGRLVDVLAG